MIENKKNEYSSFEDILNFYQKKACECPEGIKLKLQENKFLLLQFTNPATGELTTKYCEVEFSYEGILIAISKAHKVRNILDNCCNPGDFWQRYEEEIIGKNKVNRNRKTYGQIFSEIENNFWKQRNRNTGRKRDPNLPNDCFSYDRYYSTVFQHFTDHTSYPNWEDFEKCLTHWKAGTKQYKDAVNVLKKIASLASNKEVLFFQLNELDIRQYEFREHQSISLDQFLAWHDLVLYECKNDSRYKIDSRLNWLWVASMCICYGLRPSEIAAAVNLQNPVKIDGIEFKAINDLSNDNLLLVLGDKTCYGTSIKTGSRVATRMISDKNLIERLQIQSVRLPLVSTKSNDSQLLSQRFANAFREFLLRSKCPVSQCYAFRHLANQLGELNGIPQEIRSRSFGHSTSVNENIYKKRKNTATTVDLLTKYNYPSQPVDYDLAIEKLKLAGINTNDQQVQKILEIVYQLPNSSILE